MSGVRELPVMSMEDAMVVSGGEDAIAARIGIPFEQWGGRCHEISLAVLRTGMFGRGRVARGTCKYVTSQHSWIVLGDNCYDEDAVIVDPTLWNYVQTVNGIFCGFGRWHRPHGAGMFYDGNRPENHGGEVIDLDRSKLGKSALEFLDMLGPLDFKGWMQVAHMPVQGWPAGEIINALCDVPVLAAVVPIDIKGMVTDRNPNGLYW